MSIPAISGSTPYPAVDSMPKSPKSGNQEEITTVTTHCKEKHWHDRSCPSTVSTRPAEKTDKMEESGHELYQRV